MILDARSVPPGATIDADICIVGAGAAGIAMAREFIPRATSVVLLESGDLASSAPTQELYDGPNTGTFLAPDSRYLFGTRARYLGGTTNYWDGWCRPLDEHDFTERDWVPASGWPLTRAELRPYYDRACALLEIHPFDDADAAERLTAGTPLFPPDSVMRPAFFHLSPPTRFGQVYRQDLAAAERVKLFLNANTVELETDASAGAVERVRVATLAGGQFHVRARRFVVAAGGIENARLLLASRTVESGGLGNRSDLVGRHFMEHPSFALGVLVMPERNATMYHYRRHQHPKGGLNEIAIVQLAPEVQRRHRLLNSLLFFHRMEKWRYKSVERELGNVPFLLDDLAGGADGAGAGGTYYGEVNFVAEQSPNPDSRVTLADEKDALGSPRARLDWCLSEADAASMAVTLDLFAREIGVLGLGRVKLYFEAARPWRGVGWAHHHMGTTRMHRDPRRGVVDADAKVHGVANLYVAGSSVFPTSGSNNPTLTLVALALRLADHLKEQAL